MVGATMKKILLFLIFFSFTTATVCAGNIQNHRSLQFKRNPGIVLHLAMDGADASTTFTDKSPYPHTVTANGTAQIDTAQFKFGGASGLFNGSTDYLTIPDNDNWFFGTGDFTIEFWVRFNALPTTGNVATIVDQRTTSPTSVWSLQVTNTSGTLYWEFYDYYDAGYVVQTKQTATLSTNTWYHIAVIRNGNDFKIFQNGTQVGSTVTDADSIRDRAAVLSIGRWSGGGNYLNGWLDEFRITKGLALYKSNFTPLPLPYAKKDSDKVRGWTEYASNPVIAQGACEKLEEPEFIYEDGGYTMWYLCFKSGEYYDWYRARAADGVNYTNTPATPVLQGIVRMNIIKSGGSYYALGRHFDPVAMDHDSDANRHIYGWSSADGIEWSIMNSGNPIIEHGGAGAWDYRLENCTFRKTGDLWEVLYDGSLQSWADNAIGYASGTTFPLTKSGSNPILTEANVSWAVAGGDIGTPKLIENPMSGVNLLFFIAKNSNYDFNVGAFKNTTGSLTSGWVEVQTTPFFATTNELWRADPSINIQESDGFLWMYFAQIGVGAQAGISRINLARTNAGWEQFR